MKYRKDYVTNSSSSSYIVAIHKDFSRAEFDRFIENNIDEIERLIGEYERYYPGGISIAEVIEGIYDVICGSKDMQIDDWSLSCGEASNDSGIISAFLYNCNYENTDHFKFVRVWN